MYLTFKLQSNYTFSIDQPSALTIHEGGSFSRNGKVLGYFHSKLTQIKGSGNPQQRSFVILNLEFNRKQKGGALHFMLLLGERDMISQLENGKVVAVSYLYASRKNRLYQRQLDLLTIG